METLKERGDSANRVVVTGMGVVSPLGDALEDFRDHLLAGESGVGPLTLFSPGALASRIAGECARKKTGWKDRKISFALHAARSAMDHADREGTPLVETHHSGRRGLSIGIGLELFDMEEMVRFARNDYTIPERDKGRIDFLQTPSDICADILNTRFDLGLPAGIHISACAAGNDAIGHAFLRIRRGEASMMLAGGADSMINPMGLGGFCKLNALSTRNDAPEKASRPFDAGRDGFVLGEGAGMLVLENLHHAVRRKARIYAEICGYGNSFDAYSVSAPHPEGRGAFQAMSRALKMAGIAPARLSYINAHGTSTPRNDPVETLAIKRLLGADARRVPISSTKSMIGHLISAAGAVEAIASILCANAGWIHPTINLENPDPACDLDYTPNTAREHAVDYFLNNAFAFGGQNASLVLRNRRA
ncbi:MAG: beta-ketoacyl-[acyl-carrier-protein] synthase family protein [Desulfobacterales bacterium]|nr:beta-ketoacyl-[acyl-carrier-protein] synthase family protein [Desulfobacterales bacterium]